LNVKYSSVFISRSLLNTWIGVGYLGRQSGEKVNGHDRLSQACRGMRRDRADRTHPGPTHHASAHCGNVDESRQGCRSQLIGRRGEKYAGGFELELTAS